ncbi:MAG: nicotinate phosphoribosyltransferase [Bacillaceae bacterium]
MIDNFALHTDLYQINMVQTYWKKEMHERKATFEVYFRKLPFGNGYAVFAGLERVVQYLTNFSFQEDDLQYLREQGYEEEFLSFLSTLKFTGNLYSVKEGELVFPNEPLIRIESTLAECQLMETAILNIVNFQTLIATKAARIKHAVGHQDAIAEFGTRRAQEMDAAIWGTRAAYIAGFNSTSNVKAGKLFNIPITGTHAHAFVQVFENEYEAFKAYAETHKDVVFLVDTYDTLKSGVPNAIKVAQEMGDKINFKGIRLDSGKLTYLSTRARKMLDDAGFKQASIAASNDLDEYEILRLKSEGAKINFWGVGTKVITAYDQPALGAVYKVVTVEGEDGKMRDVIKLSENPEKVTTPGNKRVYRIHNIAKDRWEGDYIALANEKPNEEKTLRMFHPVHTHLSKKVKNFTAEDIHQCIFEDGKLVYELPSVHQIRDFHLERKKGLWEDYRELSQPSEYPVDLSPKCWTNKMKKIREIREKNTDELELDH